MIGRRSLLLGLLAVLALTGSAGAPSATSVGAPSAEAFGISVSVPGGGGASVGGVSAPPNASTSGGFAFGSIASAASVSSSVTGSAGSATTKATASVEVSGVSLFGGEIAVGSVTAASSATATARSASGDTSGSSVSGLVVLGQPVAGTPGTSVPYGTWGSVSVLQLSAGRYGSGRTKGFQAGVTALVVHLTAEHAGAAAGTDIVIGYTDVAAEMRASAPKPPPTTEQETQPKPKPKKQNERDEEEKQPSRGGNGPPPIRDLPLNVFPKLTAGRYVFPVYGEASYTNTFGAPRANTGWHHGEDIFAPLGAPILAVADGIVYSVGWNDVGGLRFWLQDEAGNEYYYAHLSAFSPLAVNGAQVRAGDVLGFMGNTGDAEHTPYHLHFEIHPASMLYLGYDGVVPPYPYLNAWKRLVDLSLTAVSGWAPPISDSSRAPKPGAILIQARDISSATGLEPGSLRRAMRALPESGAEGSLDGLVGAGREALRALARASGP